MVSLAVATGAPGAVPVSAAPQAAGPLDPAISGRQTSPAFLGFGLGDERRYVLGPTEELYIGESAWWSIQLREVLADPPDGVFALAHEWSRARTNTEPPVGTVMRVSSSGELRVNGHGFPLEARFRIERDRYGFGASAYTVRYRFEEGTFHKQFGTGGNEFEHPVRIRSTDDLDTQAPAGMWAHAPMALACMFLEPAPYRPGAGGAMAPPSLGSGGVAAPTQVSWAREAECREPLFANPGLLSLLMPTLWEAGTGELEFLMLTPAGDFGMPGVAIGGNTTRVAGAAGNRPFDSQDATRPQTNSDIDQLRYRERVRVDIGPRTMDAWRFDGMNAFDNVFVDDDGVVLRVDLAPRMAAANAPGMLPDVGGGRSMDACELWIRLLFPSEY